MRAIMRKHLAAKIGVWLGAVFAMMLVFGWDILNDIDALQREAAHIEASNRQSHDLHALEIGLYACIHPIKEFLITGDYRMASVFEENRKRLLAAVQAHRRQYADDGVGDLAAAIERIRPKAETVFHLPFPVGNMEGPILLREIEKETDKVVSTLSRSHRELDNRVNMAMQTLAGLRQDMRNESLATLLVLLLAMALLTGYMYQHVVRPLIRLRRATQKLGDGDFSVRCPVESEDELGSLAAAFNAMAAGLKEREEILERNRSMAAHQEKMHALGMMAAGIAHEVGNPLAAISVSLQLAARKLRKGDGRDALPHIQTAIAEVERTEDTVRQILDYGRPDHERRMHAFAVEPAVRAALNLARMSPHTNQTKFTVDIDPALPPAHGAEGMLMQVLINLLLNAMDACDKQGRIRIHAFPLDGGVAIDIQDNGSGIPKALQPEIFKPMFTTKPEGQGTGLGLPISRGLCERMGGRLDLLHSDETGSCFRIWLPSGEVLA